MRSMSQILRRAAPYINTYTKPYTTPGRRAGRMRRVGKNIVDENGNPWIGRGYVYGQRELWKPSDSADDAAAGANAVRLMVRAWGGGHGGNTYTAPTMDAESIGSFGDMDPTYLAEVKLTFQRAKSAGLKTILAMDSNCGQNGNQDAATQGFCSLYDGSVWQQGQNFYTTLGKAQKFPAHVNRGRLLLRALHGLVDIVEPLVEPNHLSVGLTQVATNAIYMACMNAWLLDDPDLIFMLGGNAYQHAKIDDPMLQGTVWPTSNIILTADALDNIMTQSDATWALAVKDFTDTRTSAGYPVFCQQAGTKLTSDADSSLLGRRLDDLNSATGGSIGWTMWEKISKGPNNYGPWNDPTLNAARDGAGRVLSTGGNTRRALIESKFGAARISAT
jgi:hypothetical protein